MILYCNEYITFVRIKYNSENDTNTYHTTVVSNCSWFCKYAFSEITGERKGINPTSEYVIRIQIPSSSPSPLINLGDIAIRGKHETITSTSDYMDLEHFLVEKIGDNRRGVLSHFVVKGR